MIYKKKHVSLVFIPIQGISTVVQLLSHVQLFATQLHRLQHTRLPCPSLSPRICSNSCALSQWFHPTSSCSFRALSSLKPLEFPKWRELSNVMLMRWLLESPYITLGRWLVASGISLMIKELDFSVSLLKPPHSPLQERELNWIKVSHPWPVI